MLSTALDVFLEFGFEGATVDEIGLRLGMSKRTIYNAYKDKVSLFKASVLRAIDLYTVPASKLEEVATSDLRETLSAIARLRLENVCTERSLKLQRILNSLGHKFPELAQTAFQEGTGPTVAYLSKLFKERAEAGEINVTKPEMAASAFLTLVVGFTARYYIVGNVPSPEEAEEKMTFALDLFLNGILACQ